MQTVFVDTVLIHHHEKLFAKPSELEKLCDRPLVKVFLSKMTACRQMTFNPLPHIADSNPVKSSDTENASCAKNCLIPEKR